MAAVRNSKFCFGTEALGGADWGDFDLKGIEDAIHCSIENGLTSFDTAAIYGLSECETRLGKILGTKINDVEIATKGGLSWSDNGNSRARVRRDASAKEIQKGIENSCRRLGRTFLDIYYIHWPDENTPFSETFTALQAAKDNGLIKHIGVSNFSEYQILEAQKYAHITYAQAPMNIISKNRNTSLRRFCAEQNIKFVSYNTLASGLLSGKYHAGSVFPKNDRRHRLSQFEPHQRKAALKEIDIIKSRVSQYGLSMIDLSISWALAQLDVHQVIIGIKTRDQLNQNLAIEKSLVNLSHNLLEEFRSELV